MSDDRTFTEPDRLANPVVRPLPRPDAVGGADDCRLFRSADMAARLDCRGHPVSGTETRRTDNAENDTICADSVRSCGGRTGDDICHRPSFRSTDKNDLPVHCPSSLPKIGRKADTSTGNRNNILSIRIFIFLLYK